MSIMPSFSHMLPMAIFTLVSCTGQNIIEELITKKDGVMRVINEFQGRR